MTIAFACPRCGTPLACDDQLFGAAVFCPSCGRSMTADPRTGTAASPWSHRLRLPKDDVFLVCIYVTALTLAGLLVVVLLAGANVIRMRRYPPETPPGKHSVQLDPSRAISAEETSGSDAGGDS